MIIKKCLQYLLIAFIAIPVTNTNGQNWRMRYTEGFYGIGATNTMVDIGSPTPALAGIVEQYFWLTPQSFRVSVFGGGRYVFNNKYSLKVTAILAHLSAADIYGDSPLRNLKTNTFLFELSGQFEYYFIPMKKKQNVHRLSTYRWYKNFPIGSYMFLGIGESVFWANTKINQKYINEPGYASIEFVPTLPDKFKYTTPVIPFGLGLRFWINPKTRLGIEAGYRFAFSDYIDEKTSNQDSWPDSYQFVLFSLNFRLESGTNGLPDFINRYLPFYHK